MACKTIAVEDVRRWANNALANTSDEKTEYRWGTLGLLQSILHETGNYRGFSYLDSEYAKPGDEADEHAPMLRKGYDDTRRRYS